MECNGVFSLAALPLEKLSAIAVVLSYWEQPDVIRIMDDELEKKIENLNDINHVIPQQFCCHNSSKKLYINFTLSKTKVLSHICEKVDSLQCPKNLVKDIKTLVAKIWLKICHWEFHVINVLRLDEKYAKKIYWTSQGEIDQLKIVEDFWLKDTKFFDNYCCQFMYNYLFCTYVICSQKKFFTKHFEDERQELFHRVLVMMTQAGCTLSKTIVLWVHLFQKNSEEAEEDNKLIEKYLRKQLDKMPVGSVFLSCISKLHESGAKYFLAKLASNEKSDLVVKGAERCIATLLESLSSSIRLVTETVSLKILLFLINEMSEVQKLNFIPKNFAVIFKALKLNWPYEELCEKVLYAVWDHIPVEERESYKLQL